MIVIPMAGLSSRFTKAGYSQPKYMLPLGDKTVFTHSMESFSNYFEKEEFLFIARDINGTQKFIEKQCEELGIKNYKIVILSTPTNGQAETVELGLLKAGISQDTSIGIFNIDTFRPNFSFPKSEWFLSSDGYLEVFHGSGSNWSYVKPSQNLSEERVVKTTEKEPISNLCCDGFYYFSKIRDFYWALNMERKNPSNKELYIAPIYNHLISSGKEIHYSIISDKDIIFCGVPDEYIAAKKMFSE